MTIALSRRAFVRAGLTAAGGLAVAALVPGFAAAAIASGEPWGSDAAFGPEVGPFVVVGPDNSITLRIAKAEMGQGVLTALAMILAEELMCDASKVRVEYASAHRNLVDGNVYQSMGTGGSSSVRRSRVFLQQAGASARERLIAAAAAQWGAAAEACVASGGVVRHEASGRAATYGELAGAAARITLPTEPAIKTPDRFALIGSPLKRFDTPLKATGAARFGIDVKLPGMAYAAVANCPVFGGRLRSCDASKVTARRGVLAVLPVTNGVAVAADNFWRAKEALAALPIDWDFGPAASTDSAQFRAEYRAALDGPLADGGGHGDIAAALASPGKRVEALYEVPYLAHAPMEPLNATAHWTADRIDVWMGTQFPEQAIQLAAQAGGVDPAKVTVHNCYLGGGFGRRAVNDELTQAVEISKALGRPAKVVWTREEDIRSDRYRPQAALRMRAALNGDGAPAGFEFTTAVGSITRSLGWGKVENGVERQAVEGLANCPYRAGALKVLVNLRNTHVPVMFWRSVGSSQNAFALESFIDEVAHAAGRDPVEYRRALLADRPDFLAVLDALAERSGWGKPLPKDVGRGIAIHESFGTIVGEVAEVSVRSGEVKVERVVACVDCGHLVNPLTAAMQIESAVLYGLTAALFGEITIRDGRVEQGNFDSYPIARMADAPRIETHFVLSGGDKWGGLGEPGTPPIAPAIANAIFALTGKRIRALPLKNAALGA
ncbi:isoquinoline 1-oxidoreductase beta subunit [Roseiarcus fermentans]|uniref:Isoquinoline 1-oxidoreductase beta subunit n=1 Tax=Roseiarcus fermentans TaxID=1473586 RepID=A0A366EM83_9HYPH|nr:xanthine dehydrogenase family protein molybdopterin-binding subunit [Roseiarcus fermentans]RBP03527.1 isoquinoline 1-oxidoreductase beta subunit [Roseiarcus fermentans]